MCVDLSGLFGDSEPEEPEAFPPPAVFTTQPVVPEDLSGPYVDLDGNIIHSDAQKAKMKAEGPAATVMAGKKSMASMEARRRRLMRGMQGGGFGSPGRFGSPTQIHPTKKFANVSESPGLPGGGKYGSLGPGGLTPPFPSFYNARESSAANEFKSTAPSGLKSPSFGEVYQYPGKSKPGSVSRTPALPKRRSKFGIWNG